jgi:hypothetical protein
VNDNGQCRIRYNHEVYELHKEPDLVTCIKIRRLHWAGHIQMENTRIPKNALNGKFGGARTAGRPRGRWEDANDRTTWRQKVEETKARYGL